MEKALDLIEKLLDNFNLGRAVIYTLATLFITVPLFMLAAFMLSGPVQKGISTQILHDLSLCKVHFLALAIFSYMLSFTLVSAAYALFQKHYKQNACPYSAAFFYSELKQAGAIQWYVSEYIRFFEAAYYVPLGIAGGITIFSIYFLCLLISYENFATNCFLIGAFFLFAALILALYLGTRCWLTYVCVPIYKKCQITLCDLINDACCNVQTSKQSEDS